jgi:hypothetical protein
VVDAVSFNHFDLLPCSPSTTARSRSVVEPRLPQSGACQD